MDQIVLMVGTLVASAIGIALLGLVVRSAIRNSRKANPSTNLRPLGFGDERDSFAASALELAVRGYDSPELCREDQLARFRQSTDETHLN
jgi:hypothetical protein